MEENSHAELIHILRAPHCRRRATRWLGGRPAL